MTLSRCPECRSWNVRHLGCDRWRCGACAREWRDGDKRPEPDAATLADPVAHAEAVGVQFSEEQREFLAHHLAGGLQAICLAADCGLRGQKGWEKGVGAGLRRIRGLLDMVRGE